MDFDSYLQELITEVKGLFGGGKSSTPSEVKPSNKPISSSPGTYTAPIHGSYASSGGFTYQPNATHPHGHMGVDLRCPGGTPIYPIAAGVVTGVGTDPMGGNVVNISYPNGIRTYYAHCGTISAQKGDKVDQNTVVATVGNTGNAKNTWAHCHVQVWKDNNIQDPAKYFNVPPYTDLSAQEKQRGMWLSEQAKLQAQNFDVKKHVAEKQIAAHSKFERLLSLANEYEKLLF
jgi:murein DD-endopeptidase MepM/ murein hydrolase activator NlpD